MKLYPLKFHPIYKEKIWGGQRLNSYFQRQLPAENIGESWEIAAHPHGTSIIANGKLAGTSLTDIIDRFPEQILGKPDINTDRKFPLLIKLLDARKKLSVQVHPDDKYALEKEGEPGKTEMWYIIDADPGAELIYGLKPGTTRKDMARAIEKGKLEDYLNSVSVEAGDVFFIPSGTVHSLKQGVLLAEIQQNSDTTYRVYDWNRTGKNGRPRKLHINRALEVTDFNRDGSNAPCQPLSRTTAAYTRSFLAACRHFVCEKIELRDKYRFTTGNRFMILMVIKGQPLLKYRNGSQNLNAGQTLLIPAGLGELTLKQPARVLVSYLPENSREINNTLKQQGFSQQQISSLAGIQD